MAKAKAETRQPEQAEHPLIDALKSREGWSPRPFTRVVCRISSATRDIADSTNPIEHQWRLISQRALTNDLPLWIVLGDSISQGVGATDLSRSWVARVGGALAAEGRPHAIVNLSRSGALSGGVRDEQLPLLALLERTASITTCCVGSNDVMRNPNPRSVAARVTELIADLPAGTTISTMPAPSASPTGRWVNRRIRQAAEAADLTVADVAPHLLGPRKGLAADRFHPSDAGYQAWVSAFVATFDIDPAAVPDQWDPPTI